MALWMGAELYATGAHNVAITLIPGSGGVFKVVLNGETAYDKSEMGRYPDLKDAKEIKAKLLNMIKDAS